MKKNYTFLTSFIISLSLVAFGITMPIGFKNVTNHLKKFIVNDFGWLYLLLVTSIFFICIFFMISPLGQIKLGQPNSKPEYKTTTWIAMMFSAGMGIGLVFYGAAEPLSHFIISSPRAKLGSNEALADAFRFTFFHWGLHAWAVYGIIALSLAYFGFRKQENHIFSVTLKPLLGEKTDKWYAKIIDIITIVATVIGIATTLGFGAAQINGGLAFLFKIPNNAYIQIIIILITSAFFIISSTTGLSKGLKILSNTNIFLAILLLTLVIIIGPSVKIFDTFTDSLGLYLQNFLRMSFRSAAFDEAQRGWINSWTIFYWAWWISWSPFVGIFIARISKGRTIREFLLVVLLFPTLFSFIWFSAFGTLSTQTQISGFNLKDFLTEEILFATFSHYSLGTFLSIIAVILIFLFFITSADSATYVLAMLSENGNLKPKNTTKVIWGISLCVIAMVLLLTGGLAGLQNALIIIALPFSFIIIIMIIALIIELFHEKNEMGLSISPDRYPKINEPFKSYE